MAFHGDPDELSRLRQDPEVERRMKKRVVAIPEYTEELVSDHRPEVLA